MSVAKLIYDAKCPICTNYVQMIRRKVPSGSIEFIGDHTDLTTFQYVTQSGETYSGNRAIEVLAKDFPSVLGYMWMLPEKYKVSGLKAAASVGGVVRNAYNKITRRGGCNCGRSR